MNPSEGRFVFLDEVDQSHRQGGADIIFLVVEMSQWTSLPQKSEHFYPELPAQLIELFFPHSPCSPHTLLHWVRHGETCCLLPSSSMFFQGLVEELSSDWAKHLPRGQTYHPWGHRVRPWENAGGEYGELDWLFSFPNFISHCNKKYQLYRIL